MLPGVRFLFATTILAVSVVIFGLGAAAFLRAAHDNLASAATWRPIDEPMARRAEPVPPTLAMLRVDPEPTALSAFPLAAPLAAAAPDDSNAATTSTATNSLPDAPPSPAETVAEPRTRIEAAPSPVSPEPAQQTPPVQAETQSSESPGESMAAETDAGRADADSTATLAAAPSDTVSDNGAPPAAAASEPIAEPETVTVTEPVAEPTPAPSARTAPQTPPATETPPVTITAQDGAETMPDAATSPGTDTLRAEDRQIRTAMVTEPALPDVKPLPAREVKIPVPRIDPAVLEARRKRLVQQQQARAARAAKARRIAVQRARAAAQARATAPAPDPFGNRPNAFPAAPR